MSDAPTSSPTPPTGGPVHNSSKVTVRNIIIGAITTIIGSTSVYYLTQYQNNHKGGASDYLVTKEATSKAWKSYVTLENIYTKNTIALTKQVAQSGLTEYWTGVKEESDKFIDGVEAIAKEPDIDRDMLTALTRRLENEKKMRPRMADYIDNLKRIMKSDREPDERRAALLKEDNRWTTYSKGVSERAVNDISDLAKTLSERYGQQFSLNDFVIYQMMEEEKQKMKKAGNDDADDRTNNNNDRNANQADERNADVNDNAGNNREQFATTDNNNNQVNTNGINASAIIGDWNANGAYISLLTNGEMNWEMPNGDYARGSWKLLNDQITMNASSKSGQRFTWVFDVSNLTAKSFTMKFTASPYNVYYLVRSDD